MAKILYCHWNLDEARERAPRLRKAGHSVEIHAEQNAGSKIYRKLRANPPEAILIDLDRLPSHGRELGSYFRRAKETRHVPLVFIGGAPEKVAGIRSVLPDAAYTEWTRLQGALTRALKSRPKNPVVPTTNLFGGGTPLPKKLGIKADTTVVLLGAPENFEERLGELPRDVHLERRARGRADLVLLFAPSLGGLFRRLPTAKKVMKEGGSLWIAWPKKASGVATDLTQQAVRETGLACGLVDYKICSIDDTWSGLRFARRVTGRDSKVFDKKSATSKKRTTKERKLLSTAKKRPSTTKKQANWSTSS